MQTFLPYGPDFAATGAVLDRQRLGKQRVETLQILRTLAGITDGWRRHPAVRMWGGHERWLADYGLVICEAWVSRGYRDTCAAHIRHLVDTHPEWPTARPEWLDRDDLVLSHRSNLVRKDVAHYGSVWPGIPADLPYVWPVP